MPKVKNVEKNIWDLEHFKVEFRRPSGKDVHGAKEGLPKYRRVKAAAKGMTVRRWKQNRFNTLYPGYDVAVYDGEGNEVPGHTKLETVRGTYRR